YPIINLRKDKVYQLAKLLKINNKIIEKKPSAGLWQNQTDEQELGFSYFELENYFKNKPIANKTKLLIEKWHNQTKHKRNSLIKPKKYKELS
ncbi:MAG: NAD(+) synthase, partial [Mycoplasma sp.]|nr:NAD(+) synthase [Mycoplasma sp.]